jgi:hypothetical protein
MKLKCRLPTLKPRLLARHLWCLRREVMKQCRPATWKRFVEIARESDEAEPLMVSRFHFGFGMLIRNAFLYRGPWMAKLEESSGVWLGGADGMSALILTWLVWSVRRRATSLKAAQDFVNSGCWTREARVKLLMKDHATVITADHIAAPQL